MSSTNIISLYQSLESTHSIFARSLQRDTLKPPPSSLEKKSQVGDPHAMLNESGTQIDCSLAFSPQKKGGKVRLKMPACSNWQPRTDLSIENATKKMLVNSAKALLEHRSKKCINSFIKEPISLAALSKAQAKCPILFSTLILESAEELISLQKDSFYAEFHQGILTGVFHGSSGKKLSERAVEVFHKHFPENLDNEATVLMRYKEARTKLLHENPLQPPEFMLLYFINKNTGQLNAFSLGVKVDALFCYKLRQNLLHALAENQPLSTAYASHEEILFNFEIKKKPLSFTHTSAESIGIRETMEDQHFFIEKEEGILTAVLDGHGGHQAALLASSFIQAQFFNILTDSNGNVYQALESLIYETHKRVTSISGLSDQGSTLVLCYIDKKSHKIYTATLGDSEANIYRILGEKLKSIPLSCLRDWSNPHDALRAAIALNEPAIATHWPLVCCPKDLRYKGLNVSRAIGDADYDPVTAKPIFTLHQLYPGDIVILACDGLKDYASEEQILNEISTLPAEINLAQHLVDWVLKTHHSQDNVTVIAIKTHPAIS